MSDWFETLHRLHMQVWHQLICGVTDRDAPARHPTLATVSPAGWPEARTVALRRAVQDQALIEVYTDAQSDKVSSLRTTPRAALHVWEPALNLQLRIQADVTLTSGDKVSGRWDPLPEDARQNYGITPAPGTAIATALDYVKSPEQSRFCVLSLHLTHLDVVHLGERHRRAVFSRSNDWQGQWVAP